jgi:SH3-like domain-containing protein
VVIDPTVVAPVVVAPPVQVTPEVVNPVVAPVVAAPVAARLCTNGSKNVSLRTGPNQNFALVATLSPGVPLTVQRNQVNQLGQDWSLVNAGGYEGFIPSGHICYGS